MKKENQHNKILSVLDRAVALLSASFRRSPFSGNPLFSAGMTANV
jgi:hypothetical protein